MSDQTSSTHAFIRVAPIRTLALAISLACAPTAFAQDAAPASRFNATLGYAHMVPRSTPGTIAGSEADLDGSGAPTLSGSWFVNDNIALELWGSAGNHIGIGTPDGAMATAGVDFNITDRWFARADARYLHGKADVSEAGQATGEELRLDPWVVGVGMGVRF